MTVSVPYVSVCLPVYNGELYVRDAIVSVLQQSFEDIELIISDNASTDGTAEICHEFVERDSRVRYFRSDFNCGLALNHNRAVKSAIGQFSMWFGHDDMLEKEYIARCLATLEQDPGLVLCFTHTKHIDKNGNLLRHVALNNPAASGSPSRRFQEVLYQAPLDAMIYGLIRVAVLKQTPLYGGFAECDRVLLGELALRGRFALIPEPLYIRRFHPLKTSSRFSDTRERTLVFDPAKAGKVFCPELLKAAGFYSAIRRASPLVGDTFRCYKHLLGWLWNLRRIVCKDVENSLRALLLQYLPAAPKK